MVRSILWDVLCWIGPLIEKKNRTMPKGAQKRIDQTVTFIQENHNLRLEVRKVVAEHCQYYTEMDRVGPVFHNKKHLTTFSKSMSQKDNPNAGEKPARHYRRALRMLYRSMDRFDEEKTVDAMPEANLIPAFRTIADEVYLYADKAGIACRAKLNEFRASPKQFLDDNEIFISGHKKKETGHVRGPAWFLMHYEPARERFVFDPMGAEHDNPDLPGYRFQAISVPAVAHDDASEHKNFQELVPTELKDLDIMLTTQFSGCSFYLARRFARAPSSPARRSHGPVLPEGPQQPGHDD